MLIKFFSKLPKYVKFIGSVFILQLIIFFFYRVIHSVYNYNHFVQFKKLELLHAFAIGLQFDISIISYLSVLLLIAVSMFSVFKLKLVFQITYTIFIGCAILAQLVFAASIPYYYQFGSHLNEQMFLWKEEKIYMLGLMIGSFNYWGFIIPFIISMYLTLKFCNKSAKVYLYSLESNSSKNKIFGFLIIILFLLLLGIRGRVAFKTPLHEGISIISQSSYINSIALNPNFTFWKSSFFNREEFYAPPQNINSLIKQAQTQFGFTDNSLQFKRVITPVGSPTSKNVVIVIMESMCLFKMGYYNGEKTYPLFDSIVKESIFFDHFFSSGIHTFNGIFSSLSGFPSVFAEQPLKSYTKKSFNGLGKILKQNGYYTSFYTTHDKHFDNMSGFLKLNSFDDVFGDETYSSSKMINNLGVPDHVLFDEFIKQTSNRKNTKPFFAVLLTSSDHGPWDVPKDIEFKPNSSKKENAAAQYADWAAFNFLQKAKKQNWYENTIFVFVGDHGLSMGHTYQMPISYHHIPFVIHCPQLLKSDTISKIGYQPDIPATLLGMLNISYTDDTFGINLLSDKNHSYVFFTADDKFGCVTKTGYYYFHLKKTNSDYLYKYSHLESENLYNKNKIFTDSLKQQMNATFESARYFIHQNYYRK